LDGCFCRQIKSSARRMHHYQRALRKFAREA
jgi:hypothetical protein